MAYSINKKRKAIKLRKTGHSLGEINEVLGVAKGTLSEWFRDIVLDNTAKQRILGKIKKGQFIAAENKKKKTREKLNSYYLESLKEVGKIKIDKNVSKLLCSLIYWCEGVKSLKYGLCLANSDPYLVSAFLKLLRNSFDLKEEKFRVCIHLHKYHDVQKQINFWSGITHIPAYQFTKPFQKQNTGKRIRENYMGCASIRYHDCVVARKLMAMAKAFIVEYNK